MLRQGGPSVCKEVDMFVIAIEVPSKAPIYEAAIALVVKGGCTMKCPDMETAGAHSLSSNRDVNSLIYVCDIRLEHCRYTNNFGHILWGLLILSLPEWHWNLNRILSCNYQHVFSRIRYNMPCHLYQHIMTCPQLAQVRSLLDWLKDRVFAKVIKALNLHAECALPHAVLQHAETSTNITIMDLGQWRWIVCGEFCNVRTSNLVCHA